MSTAADKKPAKKPYDRLPNGKGKVKLDEDAGKIRRPQNSWILYRKDKFELLRKEAEAENKPRPIAAEASKIISEAWKNESPEVKKYYNDLAEKEKARHAEEHPDYKFKPKTKAQKLQEREAKELAKKRKGDDLRNERETKLASRSTRGVGSDKVHPSIPAGIHLFYPPFPMGPPPLPGQPPGISSSVPRLPWFPFPYPAYLPTPTIPLPVSKTSKASTTAAEATTSESESGSGHQAPGLANAAKAVVKEQKRCSMESNSTTSSQSASSAGTSAPADSRATATSPPIVTPPTIQQEVGAPRMTLMRKSSSSSSHSATEAMPASQVPLPIRSKTIYQTSSQPAPPSPFPPSFDLNLLGIPLAGPPIQPSSSSTQSYPTRSVSDPPNPFVDPQALSLVPSSNIPISEPIALPAPFLRRQPDPCPTHPLPGSDPVLESLCTTQDIFSYPCDTLDLPFPASQEAFDLAGFDELNFTPGAGQIDLDEMFDWQNVVHDGELRKWGGGWEGFDNTCATGLDLGGGGFELDEILVGDDARRLGLDGAGIESVVGLDVGVDTAVNATGHVGMSAALQTPSRFVTGGSTFAGSSSGSSGPGDLSGSGSGSDGLSIPDLQTSPTSKYANYAQHLQLRQSQTEAQRLWEIPIEDSSFSLSDYVDYTMCRTPSVTGPSRGTSLGPSRPLSRTASASACGTGRGRSLSRSSVTGPSRGRSVGSTRGRSTTKNTAGGSSRATSQSSRADSREGVGQQMGEMGMNSFAGISTGHTPSQGSSGELGIGLDLSEMQVDPPPPTLPPPSAIIGGPGTDIKFSSMVHQPVPSSVFRGAGAIGGMGPQVFAVVGGMLPGSSATTRPMRVQPNQLGLLDPPTSSALPSSMPPSSTIQPQLAHIQGMPRSRSDIPTVSSEDLAGIAGQGAIAWDPSQPPPDGYLLVAVPISKTINPATTSSNLIPGTALSATGAIHSSFSSASGTEFQNSAISGMVLPTSGIETWDINSVGYPSGVIEPNGLEQEQDQNVQSQARGVQGGWMGFGA